MSSITHSFFFKLKIVVSGVDKLFFKLSKRSSLNCSFKIINDFD